MAARRGLLAAGATAAMAVAWPPSPARAADWQPDRPIAMIVAFAAGGGTDTAARTLGRFMERDLGQPVVVTNRAGAGGEIGWSELARAKPDGHTIGFTNTPNIITVPIERQAARFRFEDFAFIANIVDDPGGMWVLADSPIASLAALVEEARRRPGEISYGTTGVGSDDHLAMLALQRLTGTRFLHVPFGGSSQVRTALLSRQLNLAVVNMAEGVADWRQGWSARSAPWRHGAGTARPRCPPSASWASTSSKAPSAASAPRRASPARCWTGWRFR
jgi:tripartite-type tricarboxylate transporter receptor subunit TctC